MGWGNFVAEIDKMLVRNMKLSRDLLMLVSIIFFIGCETETEYIWNDENRISEYATWIDNTICRQTVDNLDFMFQASAYRDSLLCGGDVNAVIKRSSGSSHGETKKDVFTYEGLEVDFSARIVTIDGKRIEMTPKEYDLFFFMVKNKGLALTREKLISEVWGYDFFGDERTLDTHIKLLRKSLGDYSKCIVTLRGVGYRFETI